MQRGMAVIAAAVLLLPCFLFAQSEMISVKAAVDLMEKGLQSIENMTANYVIENDGYRNAGTFFYKKPFSIRLNSATDASQIVSNGKLLWIYIPYYGIVAEQDIVKNESEYNQLLSSSRKNFEQLKQDYSFRFAESGRNDPESYILDLEPRVSKIGFKSIRLWVAKNTGMITRVLAWTVNNKQVSITFTNIKTDTELQSTIFWFGMPDSNVQVIRNTILPLDIFDKARRQ
jgi:outer membrane lipoprotein-sorting protein